MRLTHFFIDRPRFATVLSIFVTAFGLGALAILPIAQYPEIVPPTVQVTASYPGASAETVARTVAGLGESRSLLLLGRQNLFNRWLASVQRRPIVGIWCISSPGELLIRPRKGEQDYQ